MRRVVSLHPAEDPLVTTPAELGAAIRAARSAAKLSIADAALQLGIAKQTLSNLETAKAAVGVDTALRAAREFGVALFAVPAAQRELVRRAIKTLQAEMKVVETPPSHPSPAGTGPVTSKARPGK